tara:strand:- start:109045 stop:109563 length:519 start_codon:yes stop_codon:yes gene_type:complete
MIKILKATIEHIETLAPLSVEAFIPAHGHSSPKKDIESYIAQNFSTQNFKKELTNPAFEYYLIYYNNKAVGFSKVIFNTPHEKVVSQNVTKMERLYILKECYGLNLGAELMQFNIDLGKKNNQEGIWLEVWVENGRAIKFYTKMGFEIIGRYDFKVSETHSNPNHVMYLPCK